MWIFKVEIIKTSNVNFHIPPIFTIFAIYNIAQSNTYHARHNMHKNIDCFDEEKYERTLIASTTYNEESTR